MVMRLGLGAALLALGWVVAVGAFTLSLRLPPGEVTPGVRIAGVAVPPGTDVAALGDQLAARLEAERVVLEPELGAPSEAFPVRATLGDLGFGVDRELVVRRARAFGRRGTLIAQARERARLRAAGAELALALELDFERFRELLAPLEAGEDRSAAPARLRALDRTLAAHVPGRYLDLEGLSDLLWSLARSRAQNLGSLPYGEEPERIAVPSVEIAPRVSVEAAAELGGELELVSSIRHDFARAAIKPRAPRTSPWPRSASTAGFSCPAIA